MAKEKGRNREATLYNVSDLSSDQPVNLLS